MAYVAKKPRRITRGKHPNSRKSLKKHRQPFVAGDEKQILCNKISVMAKKIKVLQRRKIKEQMNAGMDITTKRFLKKINEELKKAKAENKSADIIESLEYKKEMLEAAGIETLKLAEIITSGKTSPGQRMMAIDMAFNRREGKPRQITEITGKDGEALPPPNLVFLGVAAQPYKPKDITPAAPQKVIEHEE